VGLLLKVDISLENTGRGDLGLHPVVGVVCGVAIAGLGMFTFGSYFSYALLGAAGNPWPPAAITCFA